MKRGGKTLACFYGYWCHVIDKYNLPIDKEVVHEMIFGKGEPGQVVPLPFPPYEGYIVETIEVDFNKQTKGENMKIKPVKLMSFVVRLLALVKEELIGDNEKEDFEKAEKVVEGAVKGVTGIAEAIEEPEVAEEVEEEPESN